ncbi:nuclear transport factor 2 family protein [Nocardia sp. NPDC051570]|uniref:nuclear transport factor 2 family protein n=1 Tax=Nocardia sp. NPDC051570 TaxID=3364324 RepID=UPI0037B84559
MSTETITKQIVRRLAEASGKPDEIAAVLAEDVTWWITPAIPSQIMRHESHGREEVLGNMRRVFGVLYDASTARAEVHDVIGEGDLAAVRFTLTAQFTRGGEYRNDYTVWARVRDGLVTHVWEFTDLAHAQAQARIHE